MCLSSVYSQGIVVAEGHFFRQAYLFSCIRGSSALVLYIPLIEALSANKDQGTGGLASFSFEALTYSTSEPLFLLGLGVHPERN